MRSRLWTLAALAWLGLGLVSCSSAGKPALDPESKEFYRKARLIMTGPEVDIFDLLPDAEARKEFMADFWARRNPDPTSEVNAFQEEYERRIEYANKHFNEGRKGMDTDRGRIFIFLGPPDKIERFPFNQTESVRGPAEWWIYYRHQLGVAFADVRNNGSYKIYELEGNLLDAIDQAKLGGVVQGDDRRPIDFKLRYDRTRRVLVLTIPVKNLDFKDDQGRLTVGFSFDFFVYAKAAAKDRFTQPRAFAGTAEEVQALQDLVFEFPYELSPGKSFVDVIITQEGGRGKARKIFPLKN